MKLRSLTLRNYRKFEEYSLAFDDGLTVLVGDNASGKSSVLDGAAVALGAFLAKLSDVSSGSIRQEDARVVSYKQGSVIDQQAQYPVSIEARGEYEGADLAWSRSLNGPGGRTTTADAKPATDVSREWQERVRAGDGALVLPVIAYYGTGRLWRRAAGKPTDAVRKFQRLDGYADCLSASLDSGLLLDWAKKMTIQEYRNSLAAVQQSSPELDAVMGAVERCVDLVTSQAGSKVSFNLDTHDLDVEYFDAQGAFHRDPLRTMSDGYRGALTLVADIAHRMAILNPALLDKVLEAPGVVLIDEVDLHLHPLWQARILGDLRDIFPNVQFIVSTHAPMVVSTVSRDCLRILSEEGAAVPQGETYGREAGDILEHVMNAPRRPAHVRERLLELHDLIDTEEYEQAEALLCELEEQIGGTDPDLVMARTLIALRDM